MKHRARPFLLVALCLATLCSPAEAKKKHHKGSPDPSEATPSPEPAAWPIETAPKIDPTAQPSQSLQAMVDRHLVGVLAPLGDSAFDQPEFLASYKSAYTDGLAAAPANHKAAYQLAIAVCDNMSSAITERQNAVSALRGALATQSSEVDQPRGGRKVGQQEAKEDNNFFQGTLKNNWVQRAGVLRNNVTTLCLRERDAERQVSPWSTPTPVPAPAAATPAATAPVVIPPAPASAVATPAAPASASSAFGVALAPAATPSVSAPAPSSDPLVGTWNWQGSTPGVSLGVDGNIFGSRHGHWNYTCTTNDGRNYEFKWKHKGWMDYMVLSADGKTLAGKTQDGKYVSASR